MSKFVVHKKAFYYTDECFAQDSETKGSVVGIFSSLEEAKAKKEERDLASIKKIVEYNLMDFYFYNPNAQEITAKLQAFFQKNWSVDLEEPDEIYLPEALKAKQAKELLEILEVSFHDVVEYPDDLEIDPKKFKLKNSDLGEF